MQLAFERACAQASTASNTSAAIRWSPAASAASRSPCACRAASRLRAATRRGCAGRPARSIISMPTACARVDRDARDDADDAAWPDGRSFSRGRNDEAVHADRAVGLPRRSWPSSLAHGALRAGAGRGVVLLSGRRRRPDHQDHRRLRRRLREGESRHQAEADLFRQLPGVDRQGAHRGEERRAAGDVDPAVDRHVHADRRGRDRAVRRPDQDRRRPGVAEELLPGVHGEQPDRRQDVGHSVPALDDRALLQQGGVQGSRARSEQAAGDVEGDDRVRAEAHQARRVGQGDAMGRADSVVRLSRTGCSRGWRSRTA